MSSPDHIGGPRKYSADLTIGGCLLSTVLICAAAPVFLHTIIIIIVWSWNLIG